MTTKPRMQQETGSILVMTALVLTALLAITALAIDAAFMYDDRDQMAAAADAAALAGAREIRRSAAANLQTFANYEAVMHGFNPGGDTSVVVHNPPISGSFTGDPKYVEVILSRPVPTFFARLFGRNTMTVGGRAVAGSGVGSVSNFIILDPTDHHAFNLTGGSNVVVGGSVLVNSSAIDAMNVGGGGSLDTAGGSFVVGGYTGGTYAQTPMTGATMPVPLDPFATRPIPVCNAALINGDATNECTVHSSLVKFDAGACPTPQVIWPGVYDGGITVTGGCHLEFKPGLYTYGGTVDFNISGAAIVTGTGVSIYNHGTGQLKIQNNTTHVTWTAPTSGPNEAFLYWQAASQTEDVVIGGGATVDFTGVIYAPTAQVQYTGGSVSPTVMPYTIFVVREFLMSGGGFFAGSDVSSLSHGSPTSANGSVSLGE
jgi:hypothetical protein